MAHKIINIFGLDFGFYVVSPRSFPTVTVLVFKTETVFSGVMNY